MPLPTDSIKQANRHLNEALEAVWHDRGELNPALSEPDRQRFAEEEESLRERLEEVEKTESNSSSWWPSFLSGRRSSQAGKAEKCLKEAKELRDRVRDEINEEKRRRATGRGVPPLTSFFDYVGTETPKDTRSPHVDKTLESDESAFLHASSPGVGFSRHPDFHGWPASPASPPLEATLRSPTNHFSPSGAPDPVLPTAQDANRFSSATAEQAQEWQESNEPITMTNCVSISGSNANGITLNNGGTMNSGSVIHMVPPHSPQHAVRF